MGSFLRSLESYIDRRPAARDNFLSFASMASSTAHGKNACTEVETPFGSL